jgi:hypothetical protein
MEKRRMHLVSNLMEKERQYFLHSHLPGAPKFSLAYLLPHPHDICFVQTYREKRQVATESVCVSLSMKSMCIFIEWMSWPIYRVGGVVRLIAGLTFFMITYLCSEFLALPIFLLIEIIFYYYYVEFTALFYYNACRTGRNPCAEHRTVRHSCRLPSWTFMYLYAACTPGLLAALVSGTRAYAASFRRRGAVALASLHENDVGHAMPSPSWTPVLSGVRARPRDQVVFTIGEDGPRLRDLPPPASDCAGFSSSPGQMRPPPRPLARTCVSFSPGTCAWPRFSCLSLALIDLLGAHVCTQK